MAIDFDPYYNSVSLLLLFQGSNGSTTFVDSGPKASTVTPHGGAVISSTQSKWGTTSGYFEGTNSYLTIPHITEFDFGTGDYSVELFVYFNSVANNNTLCGAWQDSTHGWNLRRNNAVLTGNHNIAVYSGDSQVSAANNLNSAGSWKHVAVTSTGGTTRKFIDGGQTGPDSGGGDYSSTAAFVIGALNAAAPERFLDAYVNSLRITKGVSRSSGGSYPVPTSELPAVGPYQCVDKLPPQVPVGQFAAARNSFLFASSL